MRCERVDDERNACAMLRAESVASQDRQTPRRTSPDGQSHHFVSGGLARGDHGRCRMVQVELLEAYTEDQQCKWPEDEGEVRWQAEEGCCRGGSALTRSSRQLRANNRYDKDRENGLRAAKYQYAGAHGEKEVKRAQTSAMTPTPITRSHHRRPPAGTSKSTTTSEAATTPRMPRDSEPKKTSSEARSSPNRCVLRRCGNTAEVSDVQDLLVKGWVKL